MGWKTWYCWDGHTPQIDVQIHHSQHRNCSWLLCRNLQADPNTHMVSQGTQYRQNTEIENRAGGLTAPISTLSAKQQQWRECGTSKRETSDPRIELRVQKQTLTLTDNWGQLNGERMVSPIHGAGTTGFPHAKEQSWTPTSLHIQKLTLSGSET